MRRAPVVSATAFLRVANRPSPMCSLPGRRSGEDDATAWGAMTEVDVAEQIPDRHAEGLDPRPGREGVPHPGMIFIPGGTFRMGSDRHYAEEAPVHRVTVDAFWMDRTPVTNRQFKAFVRATGHVTSAQIAPDPKDYPGALPHTSYAVLCLKKKTSVPGSSPPTAH